MTKTKNNRLFYLTAPSRSGSSLLAAALNCLDQCIVVNEPPDSHRIDNPKIINSVFEAIIENLNKGFTEQRMSEKGEELTDTFPKEKTSWKKIPIDFHPNTVIGIKKSFPSLGNRDYHELFINEWGHFTNWFTQKKSGKIISIIRNPIFTILSWKTTFEALRSSTEKQCRAWNRIAFALLKTSNSIFILRYEDLLSNFDEKIHKLCSYLAIRSETKRKFPRIRKAHNSLDYYLTERKLPSENLLTELEKISKLCTPAARYFGYNLDKDFKSLARQSSSRLFIPTHSP